MNLFKKNKNKTKSKEKSLEKKRTQSYNMIFIAISLAVMGSLGLVFITQMDLQPGWEFSDLEGNYPVRLFYLQTENSELLAYTDTYSYEPQLTRNPSPQWGGIFLLDPKTGNIKTQRTNFDGPIKYAFQIMDVDGDSIKDYFIDKATVGSEWIPIENETSEYNLDIIENGFKNKIISGRNLTDVGEVNTFSPISVFDVVAVDNLNDFKEDLICLEKANVSSGGYPFGTDYIFYLRSYFINGTMVINETLNPELPETHYEDSRIPKIELLDYQGTPHLLFADVNSFALYNLSSSNFTENPIYCYDPKDDISNFQQIDDLNGDGINEILLINSTSEWINEGNGTCQVLNGSNGQILYDFTSKFNYRIENTKITNIGNSYIGLTYILDDIDLNIGHVNTSIYKFTANNATQVYTKSYSGKHISHSGYFGNLGNDINGDNVNEIILFSKPTSGMTISTYQISIFDFINKRTLSKMNVGLEVRDVMGIPDIDGDGNNDILLERWSSITAASSREPLPMFLSPGFPLGLGIPLFILLIAFIVISIFLLLYFGRKFKFAIEPIKKKLRFTAKKKKLTIFTIVISVILIISTFVFFLYMLNVTESTLVVGTWISEMSIYTILVMIAWFGLLPLTAAIYNILAPYFAYFFIRLRDLFFKTSNAYENKIFVLDLEERTELGLVSKLKRILVPLFLSLTIGFYVFNTVAPILGYQTNLASITGEDFGKFMGGYMLLLVFPLILSFLIFGFFNAGNYLLDDAGIVYLRKPKKYRKPSDVEPISYWTQSIVKGVAGFSALITFLQFALALDLSQIGGNMQGSAGLFLTLMVGVIFYALPFLTGFSYILLAEELMDFSTSYNKERLYGLMSKQYETKPQSIKIEPSSSETR